LAYDGAATPRFIAEGSVMPAIGGQPTRWWFVLVGRQPTPS
jgi:hypothetical protein